VEQISDVQLAFLRALWAQPGSTVTQVKDFLLGEGRELAPTTVATQLGRLEKKGLVRGRPKDPSSTTRWSAGPRSRPPASST
jgi:predicted transcriptional regulator